MSGVGYRPPADMVASESEPSGSSSYYYSWWYLLYALIGIVLFLAIIYVAVATVTRPDSEFIVGRFIMAISPYTWSSLGLAIAFSMSILGAGCSLVGAAVKVPRVRTKNLISVLLCEAVAIYGIIANVVMYAKIQVMSTPSAENYFVGFALFWAGVAVGMAEFSCAVAVGMIGSSAVLADAHNPSLFVKILIIEIFASAIGLFGLIAAFVIIFSLPNMA